MRIILLIALLAIGGTSAARVRRLSGLGTSAQDVAFFVVVLYENEPICGGSLITADHVITTEHCVRKNPKGHFGLSVVMAKDRIETTRKVSTVRVPGRSTLDVNIAILVLSRSKSWHRDVQTLSLPHEGLPAIKLFKSQPPLIVTLTGMGDSSISYLRGRTVLASVDVKRCKHSELLCGKPIEVETTSVDEGSPIVYKETIIGIALARKSKDGEYDYYADVYNYHDFILQVINEPLAG